MFIYKAMHMHIFLEKNKYTNTKKVFSMQIIVTCKFINLILNNRDPIYSTIFTTLDA